jgi:hypothetical protein
MLMVMMGARVPMEGAEETEKEVGARLLLGEDSYKYRKKTQIYYSTIIYKYNILYNISLFLEKSLLGSGQKARCAHMRQVFLIY